MSDHADARREGTSLSRLLSSTHASLADISFQPRASLSTKVAEAPVFVPRDPAAAALGAAPAAAAPAAAAPAAAAAAPPTPAPLAPPPPPPMPYMPYYEPYEERRPRNPLQYHLYAPPPPHVSNVHPAHFAAMAFFMDPALHEDLQRKHEALYAVPDPAVTERLPEMLHVYHTLVPLESTPARGIAPSLQNPRFQYVRALTGACGDPSRTFGYQSHVYKATCVLDGKCYVLRRLAGFRLQAEAALGQVERWRKIRHPGIVAVREAFTTRAFGDHSIVFVYDFHALASTLYMEHLTVKPLRPDRRGRLVAAPTQVPERVLWSYLAQLGSVLRVVHRAGLAAGTVDASKVLCTGRHRVRLNCCGIFDVLTYGADESRDAVAARQRDDMRALGRLVLTLACSTGSGVPLDVSVDAALRSYTQALVDVVRELADGAHSADALLERIAPRVADDGAAALSYGDLLEASLLRELENGRLVRLLVTLNFVNERPEYADDAHWAETGSRYVVRLFRDMVFHAVDEHGRPVLDMSHVLLHLNKLDAGSDERIVLTSRDEQTCLLVSYADVRRAIEAAVGELV